METEAELEVPTWNQIYTMLLSQAEKIRQSGFKLDVIAGVTRGGLVPAIILADLLELPILSSSAPSFMWALLKPEVSLF